MIKKLSTLSGITNYRTTATPGFELENHDLFEVSLSGLPGYPFSQSGWASAKVTYGQLVENLSESLEDERDCRTVTLSANGSGQVLGDTSVEIGSVEDHTLNIVAGNNVIISGSASQSKIIISVDLSY